MAKKTVTIFPKKVVELFGEVEDIAKTLKLAVRSEKRFKRAKTAIRRMDPSKVSIERIRNKNSLKVKAFSPGFKLEILHRFFKIIHCEMNAVDHQWLKDSESSFLAFKKLLDLLDTNVFVYLRILLVYLKLTLKGGRYVPDDKISVDGIVKGVEAYFSRSREVSLCCGEAGFIYGIRDIKFNGSSKRPEFTGYFTSNYARGVFLVNEHVIQFTFKEKGKDHVV